MAPNGRAADGGAAEEREAARFARDAQPRQQPIALLYGRGHVIVHANPPFVAEFGPVVGLPASEALLDLPPRVLQVVERVVDEGRPLATSVTVRGHRRRLVVAPRADIETGEVYGVALRLAEE